MSIKSVLHKKQSQITEDLLLDREKSGKTGNLKFVWGPWCNRYLISSFPIFIFVHLLVFKLSAIPKYSKTIRGPYLRMC